MVQIIMRYVLFFVLSLFVPIKHGVASRSVESTVKSSSAFFFDFTKGVCGSQGYIYLSLTNLSNIDQKITVNVTEQTVDTLGTGWDAPQTSIPPVGTPGQVVPIKLDEVEIKILLPGLASLKKNLTGFYCFYSRLSPFANCMHTYDSSKATGFNLIGASVFYYFKIKITIDEDRGAVSASATAFNYLCITGNAENLSYVPNNFDFNGGRPF